MWSRYYKILLLLFALSLSQLGAGQGFQYSGTRFYFPTNVFETSQLDSIVLLTVHAEQPTCLNLYIPTTAQARHFNVKPDSALIIRMDTLFNVYRSALKNLLPDSLNRGFVVEAVHPVLLSVYKKGFGGFRTEMSFSFMQPPDRLLGTEYLYFEKHGANSANPYMQHDSFYTLHSPQPNEYKIQTTNTSAKYQANTLYTVPVPQYTMLNDSTNPVTGQQKTLEGSSYKGLSDRPFGMYNANAALTNCSDPFVPGIRSIIVTEFLGGGPIPDIGKAGTRFLITSFKYHEDSHLHCMSTVDSNIIKVDAVVMDTLMRGEVLDTCSYPLAVVESEKPMLMAFSTDNDYYRDSSYSIRPPRVP